MKALMMSVVPLATSVNHKTLDDIVYFLQANLIDSTGVIIFSNCHFHALLGLTLMLDANLE